jgi:hypothetical protein
VREISLEASGEEGADEGLQVGDAEVAPHHRLQLLSRILKQKKLSIVKTVLWIRIGSGSWSEFASQKLDFDIKIVLRRFMIFEVK